MTIQFSSGIANLVTGSILQANLNAGSQSAITIHSGTQPSASTVASSWSTYNSTSSSFLLYYQTATWSNPLNGLLLQLSPPAAGTAVHTGTASWAILWNGSYAYSTFGTVTIPSTSFIVASVTDSLSNGIIRLVNTSISSGTSYSIFDGSIGTTSP